MYYGRISYICLLQICYQHNKLIVSQLDKPTVQFMDEAQYLILTHNAIKQLNILPNDKVNNEDYNCQGGNNTTNNGAHKIDSLLTLMDKTNTQLGRRCFLLNRLCNPLLDKTILRRNYDQIDDLVQNKNLLPDCHQKLGNIIDLQKMHRKMKLHIMTPKEFALLYKSYRQTEEIYELIDKSSMHHIKSLLDRDKLLEMMRCRAYIISNLNLEVLIKSSVSTIGSANVSSLIGYRVIHSV